MLLRNTFSAGILITLPKLMVSYKRLGCVKLTGKMSIRLLLEALATKSPSLNFFIFNYEQDFSS
nr:MAG TPA: hypothetical protein [Ackermannviridae sp.]